MNVNVFNTPLGTFPICCLLTSVIRVIIKMIFCTTLEMLTLLVALRQRLHVVVKIFQRELSWWTDQPFLHSPVGVSCDLIAHQDTVHQPLSEETSVIVTQLHCCQLSEVLTLKTDPHRKSYLTSSCKTKFYFYSLCISTVVRHHFVLIIKCRLPLNLNW